MSDNIKVAIKVRPLVKREIDDSECIQWNVSGNTITPVDSKKRSEGGFQFDHIFDMEIKNDVIFDTVVKPIINSAVDGFNGTVFAYGQTGSGKTYTMMGKKKEPGITPLAIQHMFDTIEKKMGREFLIRFSYFEIYNEKINDLMEIGNTDLKVREENGRIFVNNCTERVTNSVKQMLDAMSKGEKNRSIGITNMNDRSSRSHTIFRITIESRDSTNDSDGAIQISQLNLVDLAGSERASQTGATGERFKEGTHINSSLSCLGFVIKQLSEHQEKDKPRYINFRDSILTRILQASLGGNSLTAIICTVTPASFSETHCTLSFASRAKSVTNKPKLNEDLSDEALLTRYKKRIKELSQELAKANKTIANSKNDNGLADRMELLKEYIVSGNKKTYVRRRSCPVKFEINAFPLQPIIEETPKQDKIKKFKRRQSIMQSANFAKETTALADFEINLLNSEIEPEEEFAMDESQENFVIKRRQLKSRVQFNDVDDVLIIDTDFTSPDNVMENKCNCSMATSPGTPKSVLRERYKALAEEHSELAENTILEKQLDKENYETMRNLKKSLDDTSILYSDVNKKYSDLQTEHSNLMEEVVSLRKQVESFSAVQKRLGIIEIENKELHNKLNISLKAQKFAEDENVSIAYQLESLSTKFKNREKELELSLQTAWKSSDKPQIEQSSNEIIRLENLVKTLNDENEQLKKQKPQIDESDTIVVEMDSLKEKLEETNRLLKESNFEKSSLIDRLDCLSQKMLMKTKIDEYENLLSNLEEDKIHTLERFDELAKELEQQESGLEMTTLQKAVDNLSLHLTEYERENVHVRRKFSTLLAYIEFACQQNVDNKLADEEVIDISTNFKNWRKSISYDEKEKGDIILELKKFRETLIRRSKSLELKTENEKVCAKETTKIDKETSTDNDIKIIEINKKLNKDNVKLNSELAEIKAKLLESDEKWKDYENLVLKLKDNETKISELIAKLEKLETENSKMMSNFQENVYVYEKEILELKSKILNFDVEKEVRESKLHEVNLENSQLKSQISEVEKIIIDCKTKIEENQREKGEIEQEITEKHQQLKGKEQEIKEKEEKIIEILKKSKELEQLNSELKLKFSEASETIKNYVEIVESLKVQTNLETKSFESKIIQLEAINAKFKTHTESNNHEMKSLESKVKELEEENAELKIHLESNNPKEIETSFCAIDTRLEEKDAEISQLTLRIKELGDENFEFKSRIDDVEEKLKNYQISINSLNTDNESLATKLQEKEMDLSHLKIRYKELENANNSLAKSQQQSMNNTNDETYTEAGEELVKSCLAANDAFKKRLEDFEKNVSIFRDNVDEQKTFVEGIEKSNLEQNTNLHITNTMSSTPTKIDKSIICETPKSENDFTSIFTNVSYFEKMEVDDSVNETQVSEFHENSCQPENETQDITVPTIMINILKSNDVQTLKQRIKDLELQNEHLDVLYKDLMKQINEKEGQELWDKIEQFKNVKISLEIENARLRDDIQLKIHETEEIKNGIQGLKMDVEKLQQTIYLLNTENLELTFKLNAEKEKNQSELINCEKMEILQQENNKLTQELTSKVKELNSIKECKALEYEHQCVYKDKNKLLQEENNSLQNEITDLSDDLMKHIDESETIKQQLEVALKKVEVYQKTPSDSPKNMEDILEDKKHLQAEVIELKSQVTKLSNENAQVTSDQLEKSFETQKTLKSQNRHRISNSCKIDENVENLNDKIKQQEEQIEHLTIMNEKLSDLKLSACTQCSHLKELNENKRALKLEVKCLTNKLEDIQLRFQEKCLNAEPLRLKANEELNMSFTLNGSVTETMSVTLMEENIRHLSNEKETLKEEYEKLTILYQDKCSDLVTLQEHQIITNSPSTSPSGGKMQRLSKVESSIKAIGDDLQQQKEKLATLNSELQKYKELEDKLKNSQEILASTQETLTITQDNLATVKETSNIAEEKIKLLENDIAILYENIKEHKETAKDLQSQKLNLEVELQISRGEIVTQKGMNEEKNCLISQLQLEREQLLTRQKDEDTNRELLESTIKETRQQLEIAKQRIKEIDANLAQALKENQDFKNEITRLQNECVFIKNNETKETKIERELESARKLIIKETMSLTSKIDDDPSKSVSDIFKNFVKTILSKEHEVIQAVKENFDQEKGKLIEEKQQSDDAKKRANTWAKSLETDIEKIHRDLSDLESKNHQLEKQIDRLENSLKDTEHENQNLREKFQTLQIDHNQLQTDFEKIDLHYQEIENQDKLEASIKHHELEFQTRMKQQKEEYNQKLEELEQTVKNLQTVNMDLKNNVEGLEINEKQLKNIIDIKTNDLSKNNQLLKELHSEVNKITQSNDQLIFENQEKRDRIEEITSLLKDKCDSLSEYKTKLETLMPEYNNFKYQIEERKQIIQKCRQEIETMKIEHTQEINTLNDKIQEEEINSQGLMKQLKKVNTRNAEIFQELETVKNKLQEMEADYDKLMRKVRNSTSKHRAEQEIEDVMDKNRTLEKNLEGASNRITELMEAKAKVIKDLVDVQCQLKMIKRENDELQSLKSRQNSLIELRGKYEELLQEKNTIKLELEEKKLSLAQKEKYIQEIEQQLNVLRENNEELDKEADELAKKIEENECDIGKLEDENYFLKETSKKEIDELKSKLKTSLQTNTDLRAEINLQRDNIQRENEEMRCKITELENKLESMSAASSRCTSPSLEFDNQRRRRRSELYNKHRNLEEFSDSGVSSNCQCSELRKSISEMGREIAMKNGVIATLNIQIQSENFPYEKKCKDLQDELDLVKNKCRKLQQDVINHKKTIADKSFKECEVCKNWRLNQRHQGVQCEIKEKIYLSGRSSGFVEEYQKQERLEMENKSLGEKIKKIEKEKDMMKKLCRSRHAQIKELQALLENRKTTT
ncbi:kinesin-related protein 4-like isoform X2 [Leptopilina boulardi]|uniref:kinesin-related protein 4-like isoform X2 n=1 Tax=Leptopilina boulardi TaxID=63433 RepID=UPI0021F54714|nr:kinesin-related protein 4-like isoform X2 [Leptopilina boulardi]